MYDWLVEWYVFNSIGNVLGNLKFPYNFDSDWLNGLSCSVAKMGNMEFPV